MANATRSTGESRHGFGRPFRPERGRRRSAGAPIFTRLHLGSQRVTASERSVCTDGGRHLIYRSAIQLRIRMGIGEAPPSSVASQADRVKVTEGLRSSSVSMDAHGTPLTNVFRASPTVLALSVLCVPVMRLRRYAI